MAFEIDAQTTTDLGIFSNRSSIPDIFSIYNSTKTFGGMVCLKEMMGEPFEDQDEILERSDTIRFFANHPVELKINSSQLDFIDHYFRLNISVLKSNFLDRIARKIWVRQRDRNDLYLIDMGVEKMIFLLTELERFLEKLKRQLVPVGLKRSIGDIENYLMLPEIQTMLEQSKYPKFRIDSSNYDKLFRRKYRTKSLAIVNLVYQIDAYFSVARTCYEKDFAFPDFGSGKLQIEGLFHPLLKRPISNDVNFTNNQNVCVITGPNMAGKSTFLKALGLGIYLAHLGFPVPARKMQLPTFKGLITTVNLPDDLGMGHSHFYSEVVRLKKIAETIGRKESILVIMDELFRGTNSEDAFEGTLEVIEAFSKLKSCFFFISTHISDLGNVSLPDQDFLFKCMNANIEKDSLQFDYLLKDGVSKERLGMWILRNEKIISGLKALRQTSPE